MFAIIYLFDHDGNQVLINHFSNSFDNVSELYFA